MLPASIRSLVLMKVSLNDNRSIFEINEIFAHDFELMTFMLKTIKLIILVLSVNQAVAMITILPIQYQYQLLQ